MEWLRQWDIVLVLGALLVLCIVALFLRWFLRLDEMARTLHNIHEELRLMRGARKKEGTDEHNEEEEYYL
ncbi:MAG: hypothetical protein ACE5IQ_10355 [Candidatus Methylomirabilales bacterium]